MGIYKIIAVAIITAFLCIYLKNVQSEFFLPALICGGLTILLFSVDYIVQLLQQFKNFEDSVTFDLQLVRVAVKITIVSYLIEFACSVIEDAGIKSLSDKLAFFGRIVLLCMSLPVFSMLLDMISIFLEKV